MLSGGGWGGRGLLPPTLPLSGGGWGGRGRVGGKSPLPPHPPPERGRVGGKSPLPLHPSPERGRVGGKVSRLIDKASTGVPVTIKAAILSERVLQYLSIYFLRRLKDGKWVYKTGSRNLLLGHSECTLVFFSLALDTPCIMHRSELKKSSFYLHIYKYSTNLISNPKKGLI